MGDKLSDKLLSLAGPAGSLAGIGLNAFMQGQVNRKSREFSEKMYWIQRKNALEDWQMQAAYNSPAEQMKRLREAGLNPNLVYGNGADAQMASPVGKASVEAWNPQAPTFDLGSVMQSYLDTNMKQAQIDNLEKQGTLLDVEKLVKMADIIFKQESTKKVETDTKLGQFQLDFKQMTADLAIQQLQASLQKTQAETVYTLDNNDRQKLLTSVNVEKTIEEILSLKISQAKTYEEIKNLKALRNNLINEGLLKKWEVELSKRNLRPGDPWWLRNIAEYLDNALKNTKSPGMMLYGVPPGAGKPAEKWPWKKDKK